MAIKIGNNDITLKVGSTDVSAAYLGSILVYTSIPPEPKWIATYTGGTTSSAQCDSSSAITQNEISLTDLQSVEIGDCVGKIDSNAFRDCSSLTSVTIPDSVTIIQVSAFRNCSDLTSVTIGSGVTSIGNSAFYGCTSLSSITIPDSVTSIGSGAFRNCTSLTSVTVNATTPPTLGNSAFDNTNNCPIYVPAASVSAYQSAWSTYASRIQAIGENPNSGGNPDIGGIDDEDLPPDT